MRKVVWLRTGYDAQGKVQGKAYPGIYYRPGLDGRPLYRIVVQVGARQLTKTGISTLKAARDWQAVHRLKKPSELGDPSKSRMTLQALYDDLHAERAPSTPDGYAPSTVEGHLSAWRRIGPSLGPRAIGKLDRSTIEDLLRGIEAPETRSKVRSLLSTLFDHAVERGWVPVNPVPRARHAKTRKAQVARKRSATKQHRRLDAAELQRLVNETPERYRAMVELMGYVGLRPGEAYALTTQQFDPLKRTLRIDRSAAGETKTGEPRTIPLPAVVAEILSTHIERFGSWDPEALVFPATAGGILNSHNWRHRVWVPASNRAGMGGLRVNDLRHTAVAFAIGHGADVYAVSRMVGHSKPSITLDVYGYLWDQTGEQLAERQDEAIRASRVSALASEAKVVLPLR